MKVEKPPRSAASSSQVTSSISRLRGSPEPLRDLRSLGGDHDDVAVLDLHHPARLLEEGRNRRGEERLALAEADDKRALLTSADEDLGVVGVHRDEGVVTAQVGEGGAHGEGQVAFVVTLDQVGDDLGIGLGAEDVAISGQLAAQLGVVLDDPVEDDVNVVCAVTVRMGVLLGDPAVRGPSGVGEADLGLGLGDRDGALAVRFDRGPQVGQVADRAHAVDLAVIEQRDAGGVISAVLELFEAGDQEIATRPAAHISDDAAHWSARFSGPWGSGRTLRR